MPRHSRRHSSGNGGVTGLSANGTPGNGHMIPQQLPQQLPHQQQQHLMHSPMVAGMQVAGMQPVMQAGPPMTMPALTTPPRADMTLAPANNDDVVAALFSDDNDGSLSTDPSRSRSRDRRRCRARGNRQHRERSLRAERGGRNARRRRRDRRGRSASNDSAEVLAQQTLPSGYIPRNITFLRSVPKVS